MDGLRAVVGKGLGEGYDDGRGRGDRVSCGSGEWLGKGGGGVHDTGIRRIWG